MVQCGIGLHKSLKHPERFAAIPWTLVLLMTSEDWWNNDLKNLLPQVRELAPQADILARHYNADIMALSARERAQQFCGLLDDTVGKRLLFEPSVGVIPANELDLPGEHSGKVVTLEEIGDWLGEYAHWHRTFRSQDVLHLPACSDRMDGQDGRPDRIDYWGAMPTGEYDVLDLHWYILDRDIRPALDWADEHNKPVCITEWGNPDQHELYPEFLRTIGHLPNCIYLWSSPDEQWQPWEICEDEALLEELRKEVER